MSSSDAPRDLSSEISPPHLTLWADTGEGIGAGHLMRMTALAQAWTETGGKVTIVAADFDPAIIAPHLNDRITIDDLAGMKPGAAVDAVARIATENLSRWILIDGYRFDDDIEKSLSRTGLPIAALDDNGHAAHESCELVIRPHARQPFGVVTRSKWMLWGTGFVPVRKEFRDLLPQIAGETNRSRIVVTMGAADPEGVCCRVAQSLANYGIDSARLDFLVGSGWPLLEKLRSIVESSLPDARIHCGTSSIGKLFLQAGYCITAAGSTLYDLTFLEIPAAAIQIAENQGPVLASLATSENILVPGKSGQWSETEFAEAIGKLEQLAIQAGSYASSGKKVVDGQGAARIVRRLMAGRMGIRPALISDSVPLFNLRNSPSVRANSLRPEPIEFCDHEQWMERSLRNPARKLMIVENGSGIMIGQLRLDFDASTEMVTISLSLKESSRGQSIGHSVLQWAIDFVAGYSGWNGQTISAQILEKNRSSVKLFENCGFVASGRGVWTFRIDEKTAKI